MPGHVPQHIRTDDVGRNIAQCVVGIRLPPGRCLSYGRLRRAWLNHKSKRSHAHGPSGRCGRWSSRQDGWRLLECYPRRHVTSPVRPGCQGWQHHGSRACSTHFRVTELLPALALFQRGRDDLATRPHADCLAAAIAPAVACRVGQVRGLTVDVYGDPVCCQNPDSPRSNRAGRSGRSAPVACSPGPSVDVDDRWRLEFGTASHSSAKQCAVT